MNKKIENKEFKDCNFCNKEIPNLPGFLNKYCSDECRRCYEGMNCNHKNYTNIINCDRCNKDICGTCSNGLYLHESKYCEVCVREYYKLFWKHEKDEWYYNVKELRDKKDYRIVNEIRRKKSEEGLIKLIEKNKSSKNIKEYYNYIIEKHEKERKNEE